MSSEPPRLEDAFPPDLRVDEATLVLGAELARGASGVVHAGSLNGLDVCVKVRVWGPPRAPPSHCPLCRRTTR